MAKIKTSLDLRSLEDSHSVLLIPINYLISLSLDLGSPLKHKPSGISTNGLWVLWNTDDQASLQNFRLGTLCDARKISNTMV